MLKRRLSRAPRNVGDHDYGPFVWMELHEICLFVTNEF